MNSAHWSGQLCFGLMFASQQPCSERGEDDEPLTVFWGAQILSITVPSILHVRSLDETKPLKIAIILNRHGHHIDFIHFITSELPGEGTG